jgi:TPR repeat protein
MTNRRWYFSIIAVLIAAGVIGGAAPYTHAASPASLAARMMHSAERGDPRAQAYLGWLYSVGRGVPQHYLLAAKWYYRAAVQGHGCAQFALGLLYNKGQGVQKDLVLAYMWLSLSASQAVGEDRDFKVRIRDSVASKMTVNQVEFAQHLALRWYRARFP